MLTARQTRKLITDNGGASGVLCLRQVTLNDHKKDLSRRLNLQKKALEKTIAKGWEGRENIERSIVDMSKTLDVITQLIQEA
jgi:hypothetical protein